MNGGFFQYFIKNQRAWRFSIVLFAITGFTLNCIAYYPGFISPDSLDQYTQAITHNFSDWHPPIMAALWSLLIPIHKGGDTMFLFQLIMYWTSFCLLQEIVLRHSTRLFLLVPLFYLAPFMQNFVGNIWKDIGLAISWLLATTIMLKAFFETRKLTPAESIITILLLSYGCWIRINALPGVMPLLFLWIYLVSYNTERPKSIKALIIKTLLLTFSLIIVQVGITKFIIKPINTFPEYKLFVHDLSGIYKKTGKSYFPEFLMQHSGFDTAYIRNKYIYSTFDNIWWNTDGKQIIPSANDEQIHELQNAWIKAILHHPYVYFENRLKGFLNFIRITNSGSKLEITYHFIHPNNFDLTFKYNTLTQIAKSFVEKQRNMPYMQPWFWLLLNILIIFVSGKPAYSRIKIPMLCLAYSSLFYILLNFIVFQTDTEFRYFYWNCAALSLALILMATSKFKNNKESEINEDYTGNLVSKSG